MAGADPSLFPSGTGPELFFWILTAIAMMFLAVTIGRGAFLVALNLALIMLFLVLALIAYPAHGQYYPRWDPEQHRVVPQPVHPRTPLPYPPPTIEERCQYICTRAVDPDCKWSCVRALRRNMQRH